MGASIAQNAPSVISISHPKLRSSVIQSTNYGSYMNVVPKNVAIRLRSTIQPTSSVVKPISSVVQTLGATIQPISHVTYMIPKMNPAIAMRSTIQPTTIATQTTNSVIQPISSSVPLLGPMPISKVAVFATPPTTVQTLGATISNIVSTVNPIVANTPTDSTIRCCSCIRVNSPLLPGEIGCCGCVATSDGNPSPAARDNRPHTG